MRRFGYLLEENRGISAIVAFVLLVPVAMMAISVYIHEQMPYEWKEDEFNAMMNDKNSFLDLKDISGTTNGEVVLKTVREVEDVTGLEDNSNVFSWWRACDTYVKEADPTFNDNSGDYENDYLQVSTTQGNRIWTFLKFDLSDAGIYDSGDYTFYDDVTIQEAQLLLYIVDSDLVENPNDKLQILPPQQIEAWGLQNPAWDEDINWNDAQNIHDPLTDTKIENQTIDGEGEWISWDITNYLKDKLEPFWGWGKWEQDEWWTQAPKKVGQFASRYEEYLSNTGAGTGYRLTGTGTVTSMVFDAGDVAYWNYVTFDNDGTSPTVTVYFDNDDDPMTGGVSMTVLPGTQPNIYARYAQYEVTLGAGDNLDSITLEYTYHIAFLLREPWDGGTSYTTTLNTLTRFNSGDNSVAEGTGFEPKIRIIYSRTGRVGHANEGVVDFGYVKLKAYNEFLRPMNYCYEGGAVFAESGSGWYQTIISYPSDFVSVTPTDEIIVEAGTTIRVASINVTRYQICAANIEGEAVGGSGQTTIRVQPKRIQWLVEPPDEPNRDEVTLTIITDHPSIWRDAIEEIAAEVNYVLSGYESYYTYGDYTNYDYDTIGLTIYGDAGEKGATVWTFKYSEKVVWLDVTVGTHLGGRT